MFTILQFSKTGKKRCEFDLLYTHTHTHTEQGKEKQSQKKKKRGENEHVVKELTSGTAVLMFNSTLTGSGIIQGSRRVPFVVEKV